MDSDSSKQPVATNPVLELPQTRNTAVGRPVTTTVRYRIHVLNIFAVLFSLSSIGLAIAALLTSHWYVQALGTSGRIYIGLFKTCLGDDGNNCNTNTYSDLIFDPICRTSGEDIRLRFVYIISWVAASCVLGIISIILLLINNCCQFRTLRWVITILLFLQFACLFGIAVFGAVTFNSWMYCKRSFCDLMNNFSPNVPCDGSFGYSADMLTIGVACAFIAWVLTMVRMCLSTYRRDRSKDAPLTGVVTGPMGTSSSRQPVSAASSNNAQPRRSAPTPPPAGPSHPPRSDSNTKEPPPAVPPPHGDASRQPQPRQQVPTPPPATHQHEPTQFTPPESATPKAVAAEDAGATSYRPPADGDWTFHADCGMYWSDKEFLYLDPKTGHTYDPDSEMWHDPETGQWYKGN